MSKKYVCIKSFSYKSLGYCEEGRVVILHPLKGGFGVKRDWLARKNGHSKWWIHMTSREMVDHFKELKDESV